MVSALGFHAYERGKGRNDRGGLTDGDETSLSAGEDYRRPPVGEDSHRRSVCSASTSRKKKTYLECGHDDPEILAEALQAGLTIQAITWLLLELEKFFKKMENLSLTTSPSYVLTCQ